MEKDELRECESCKGNTYLIDGRSVGDGLGGLGLDEGDIEALSACFAFCEFFVVVIAGLLVAALFLPAFVLRSVVSSRW